jgi:hypothetical protein
MMKKLLPRILRRAGSTLFGFLSGCEENGVLPKVSRWLKLTLTGAGLLLLASCAKKKPFDDGLVTCYEPVAVYPRVSDVLIKPNPTRGADSVTVTAKVHMENANTLDEIASAKCIIADDTFEMRAKDGAFDDFDEELVARINVRGIKDDSIEITVKVDSKSYGWGVGSTILRITDK